MLGVGNRLTLWKISADNSDYSQLIESRSISPMVWPLRAIAVSSGSIGEEVLR